jgi:Copper transport outer membrane protein, MctB
MAGGDAPLWDALAEQLVEERTGGKQRPADAVVVARSAPIQYDGTARFLRGFYLGLSSSSVPAVGVEVSETATSMTDVYRRTGLSSVDDVEEPAGRVALALLLAGAAPGQYGTKKTADGGILPPPTRFAAPAGD